MGRVLVVPGEFLVSLSLFLVWRVWVAVSVMWQAYEGGSTYLAGAPLHGAFPSPLSFVMCYLRCDVDGHGVSVFVVTIT